MIEKAVSQLIRTIRIRHHTFVTIPVAPVKYAERRLIAMGAGQKNRRNTKFMHFIKNQRIDPARQSAPLHGLPDENPGMPPVFGKTRRQFPTQIHCPGIMSLIKNPQREGWHIARREVDPLCVSLIRRKNGILPGIKQCRVVEDVRIMYLSPGFPAGFQIFRQK